MLHYVILRGRVPGLQSDPALVHSNIANLSNTCVQAFPTAALAEEFWNSSLRARNIVWPLDTPKLPASTNFPSRRITLSDLANSTIPVHGSGPKLKYSRVMRDFPAEWYHFDESLRYRGGDYWIVAMGRTPGIYESW